jgi:hypothetical protein
MAQKASGLPKEAKTTADLLKVVESNKDYYRGACTVEACVYGTRRFLLWYNPNAG